MQPVIRVEDLIKQYKKAETAAIRGITFDVQPGEFFAFLGPNGAGKTTTISILTTTLSKTSGTVEIAGYDLDSNAKQVRRNIGIIFQSPSLDLNLTAEENIRLHVSLYGLYAYRPLYRMMAPEYRQRISELAEIVGIKDNIFKPLKTFSGGMKRKLEIVRSLIHRPKVLFLDEPTSGLDAVSRVSLWQYLQQVRKAENITIFLTTHYLDEAESADRVCIIDQGQVVINGTPQEVKRQLTNRYMLLDAADRQALQSELKMMNLPVVEIGKGFKVGYSAQTPQKIISRLKTPLLTLQVHDPSLEEAYIGLVSRNEGGVEA